MPTSETPWHWGDSIDLYCERLGPDLLAEPLNLFSNAFMLLAAVLLWRFVQTHHKENATREIKTLIALIAVTAIGSSLFHSFATRWSMFADVIPIGAYVAFSVFVIVHALGFGGKGVLITYAGLGLLTGLFAAFLPTDWASGSRSYLGTLITLIVSAVVTRSRDREGARWLAMGSIAFGGSLFFRGIDASVCASFPWGTHFVWHTLNGVVLYTTARAAIALHLHGQAASTSESRR